MRNLKTLVWGLVPLLLVFGLTVAPAVWDDAGSVGPSRDAVDGSLVAEQPGLEGRADDTVRTADGSADDAERAHVAARTPEGDAARDDDAERSADADDGQGEILRDGRRLTADHPLVAPVIEIQERHTAALMKHPLVVGTAVGLNDRGEIAVMVLAKSEITDLPAFIGGVPLMVHVSGDFSASGRGGTKGKPGGGDGDDGGSTLSPNSRFPRPVPIGVSTGHPAITAGTIGCRVVDVAGNVYALSNNHVYADLNHANIGDFVIQPGRVDGGKSPADKIGSLDDFEPISFTSNNEYDAAIASTTVQELDVKTPSAGYGTPKSSTISAAIGTRVRKFGRTTSQTNGRISGINATVNVGYGTNKVARFVKQIVITPGSFSAGGDSGSLIVIQKGGNAKRPVALLFAGSSFNTIGSPIDPILARFGVEIDGD